MHESVSKIEHFRLLEFYSVIFILGLFTTLSLDFKTGNETSQVSKIFEMTSDASINREILWVFSKEHDHAKFQIFISLLSLWFISPEFIYSYPVYRNDFFYFI